MFAGLGWAKAKGGKKCKHGVAQGGPRKGKCLKSKRAKRLGGKSRKHSRKAKHGCPKGVVKSGPRKGKCRKVRRGRRS